jgi:UDP:flavonoid glycosyltransferase YjiC (YdhE family)
MVVLPIENHSEQIGNGEKVSELGLGLCIDSRCLGTESLLEATEEISCNDKYTSRAQEVAGIAEKLNGLENAVNAVLSSINQ